MATTMEGRAGVLARTKDEFFYVYMALACVAVAFLGFAPTYWVPMAKGTFRANPIVHIHGLGAGAGGIANPRALQGAAPAAGPTDPNARPLQGRLPRPPR